MRISVSGKQFVFPRSCACCGAYPTNFIQVSGSELNKKARTRGWVWDIPYCSACRQHVRWYDRLVLAYFIGLAIACVSGAVAMFLFKRLTAAVEVMAPLLLADHIALWAAVRLLRQRNSQNCCLMGLAARYLGSNSSCHTFDLRSYWYAAEFVRANHRKLVNVTPRIASILRGTRFGEHQVPRRLFRHRP